MLSRFDLPLFALREQLSMSLIGSQATAARVYLLKCDDFLHSQLVYEEFERHDGKV